MYRDTTCDPPRKCFVGHLIADQVYAPGIEGCSLSSWPSVFADLRLKVNLILALVAYSVGFAVDDLAEELSVLQGLHDSPLAGMAQRYHEWAKRYGLLWPYDVPVPEAA